jgi:hypothetical protein
VYVCVCRNVRLSCSVSGHGYTSAPQCGETFWAVVRLAKSFCASLPSDIVGSLDGSGRFSRAFDSINSFLGMLSASSERLLVNQPNGLTMHRSNVQMFGRRFRRRKASRLAAVSGFVFLTMFSLIWATPTPPGKNRSRVNLTCLACVCLATVGWLVSCFRL